MELVFNPIKRLRVQDPSYPESYPFFPSFLLTTTISSHTMSSTEISTSSTPDSPTTSQQPPPLTIFSRVASIPLVNGPLTTIHTTLVNNHYTSVPYVTAQNLGKSVYHFSAPIQVRLAPVLIRADGFANKSLDAVQSYYPTPFTITPEEFRKEVRERRQHAYNTLDDRVRTPAYSAAQAIDQVRSKFRSVRRFFPRLNFWFTLIHVEIHTDRQYR